MFDEQDSPRPATRPFELALLIAASLCILVLVAYALLGWYLGTSG